MLSCLHQPPPPHQRMAGSLIQNSLSNHQMFFARGPGQLGTKLEPKNVTVIFRSYLYFSIQIEEPRVLQSAWPHTPSTRWYHNLVPSRCRLGIGVGAGSPLGHHTAQCILPPHHFQQERAHHSNLSLQCIHLLPHHNNFTLAHYKGPKVCTCVIMVYLMLL